MGAALFRQVDSHRRAAGAARGAYRGRAEVEGMMEDGFSSARRSGSWSCVPLAKGRACPAAFPYG